MFMELGWANKILRNIQLQAREIEIKDNESV